ncbi:uncharacterized protein IL334_003728 [Kwoniella shivajii]|uniref:histidine kinase n=1 Tax=Kwoniella shivajii TaxID=564305 RepID=A0ABZ1CYP3_9TREE|nr:hypothetical protein IL334_003728 [Kwoniella shivajii]
MSGGGDEKGKSKANDVVVVDFAHPGKLPHDRVKEPQTQEEWHEFITRYSLGEYNESSFADDSPATPPKPSRNPSNASQLQVPSTVAEILSSSSTSLSSSPGINPILSRRGSNIRDSSEEELQEYHPDTSNAGPSNQDPEIPNIDTDEPLKVPKASSQRSKDKKKNVKDDQPLPQNFMTAENMRQLGLKQRDDRVKEREKEEERGHRDDEEASIKGRTRRRHRDHAELASVGKAMSGDSSQDEVAPPKKRGPRKPRSRGSWSLRSRSQQGSMVRPGTGPSLDNALLESGTNDSTSASAIDVTYDHTRERQRVKDFFEQNGYMPAPKQAPEAARRRLRVIRRLGLEDIDPYHRETLDRFTRLATTVFKTSSALISIVSKDRQIFLSEVGMGIKGTGLDVSFCCHSIMSSATGEQCMVVPDAAKDWRFKRNPLVQEGSGPVQFYAGAPLKVGSGSKAAIIGSLCVLDNKPRTFSKDDKHLLADLADCVVSELELIYSQQASVESAKLHSISVEFLRRSLKHRPNEKAGSRKGGTGTGSASEAKKGNAATSSTSSSGKRISGADAAQNDIDVDIYDEACREIRNALDAYAVAVVDLSQFHLFYPTYQNSSTGGGSSTRGGSSTAHTRSQNTGTAVQSSFGGRTGSVASSTVRGGDEDEAEAYSKPSNIKRARKTYAVTDPLAPSRTPQVLFIPSRRRSNPKKRYGYTGDSDSNKEGIDDQLAVLGYSCSEDGFAFNFTSSPAARKIISDFIASNVKTRKVWYTRDDNEGIAQSITHLMPPGTETSMAMPVFGFDGQVNFAVVACWTDPLYTYPAGAMQFVETIAGSLLASVMKERLHQAERAQLNFAAAASHELRTPLHQINAAASLLRMILPGILDTHVEGQTNAFREDKTEALAQLDIIEANGLSLGGILENIIDTLDIGKMASKTEPAARLPNGTPVQPDLMKPNPGGTAVLADLGEVLEMVVDDAMIMEAKTRKMTGGAGLEHVEVILEVLPRNRGGWKMSFDSGPLARALGKLVHNAVKFTEKGHVHITVQDVSRDVALPGGYDNSIKLSTISIDIKDTGRGMSADFLEREVLQPFAKEDAFTPGSGLGLGLAQRMIELLGGKLAIASTLGKGTVVHVEIPVHLLNEDNDSDQDVIAKSNETAPDPVLPEPVRQDGIYLIGWTEAKNPSLRRVGKSLARQLKLHFCRIVSEIHYASLIVVPDGALSDRKLAELCRSARPGVQLIVIGKDQSLETLSSIIRVPSPIASRDQEDAGQHGHHHQYRRPSPTKSGSSPEQSPVSGPDSEYLKTVKTIHVSRPLRPSVIKRIMEPANLPPIPRETYKSDVVGGDEARNEGSLVGSDLAGDNPKEGIRSNPSEPEAARQDIVYSDSNDDGERLVPQPRRGSTALFTGTFSPESIPRPSRRPSHHSHPHHHHGHVHRASQNESDAFEGNDKSAGPDLGYLSQNSDGIASLTSASASDSSELALPPGLKELKSSSQNTVQGLDNQSLDGLPLKVLVVEDNAINRKILTTMLKRTSCEYVEAADGFEAVDRFSSFHPDLVLLDITMPRKDGFAAAAEMRQFESAFLGESSVSLEEVMRTLSMSASSGTDSHNRLDSGPLSPTGSQSGQNSRRARIIAVTAMSAEHQRRKGLIESGIDMWMVKPIAMRELRGIVENMKKEKLGWITSGGSTTTTEIESESGSLLRG